MQSWIIALIVICSSIFILLAFLGLSFTKYLLVILLNKKKYLFLKNEVTFISDRPKIDGLLDENLKNLPIRKFNTKIRVLPSLISSKPKFRLAYGSDFFYLFIEMRAKDIIKRDRGYQNGDGFHLLLANPKQNHQLTDEFFVYGFSPNTDSEGNLEKFVWYHDIQVQLNKLGSDVQFAVKKYNRKVNYELLLPWSAAYPYHPWLMENGQMGFNLAFMKAKKILFEYFSLLFDYRFQAENKKRNYSILSFQPPEIKGNTQTYLVIDRNCFKGKKIPAKIAFLSEKKKVELLKIKILSEHNEEIFSDEIAFNLNEGLNQKSFEIPANKLPPGSFIVKWHTSSTQGNLDLTILPTFNSQEVIFQLESNREKISKSSFGTLQFTKEQIDKSLSKIKPYENSIELKNMMIDFFEILNQAKNGKDILLSKTGSFRRAFQSNIDKSFQPYSIIIPEKYHSHKKYPLIVFLHGSGVDDRNSLKLIDFIKGDYIKLAPNTRGLSHYFGKKENLLDIIEAINDVKSNYSIDEKNIILAGFSMGGYGVFRTFMEYPNYFKGLMILSGEPKIAFFVRLFTKGKFVNFLKEKNVRLFEKIPLFIFHGKLDKNCPYKNTVTFVNKLRKINRKIEFQTDQVGHKKIENQEVIVNLNEWLTKTITKKKI